MIRLALLCAAIGFVSPVWAGEATSTEPELLLSLSLEVGSEPGNAAAIAGRLQRTHLFRVGDAIDITQRFSALRKEMIAKYNAPVAWLVFSAVSHELRMGDYQQFITAEKKLSTGQAGYRNVWAWQTRRGVFGVGWGAEALRIDSTAGIAPYLADYVAREGRTSHGIPIFALWSYDRRDANSLLPAGHLNQLSVEWGTPLGNTTYTKIDATHESYWRFGSRVSAGMTLTAGSARGNRGHLTPIGKRYYGGGVGSVRGYESGSLGPVDSSGATMGADLMLVGNAEVLWHAFNIGPTPILLSVFADHGRFQRAEGSAVDRASAASRGVGISVPMSFGIARFFFADPNRDNGRGQRFQFDVRGNWK